MFDSCFESCLIINALKAAGVDADAKSVFCIAAAGAANVAANAAGVDADADYAHHIDIAPSTSQLCRSNKGPCVVCTTFVTTPVLHYTMVLCVLWQGSTAKQIQHCHIKSLGCTLI